MRATEGNREPRPGGIGCIVQRPSRAEKIAAHGGHGCHRVKPARGQGGGEIATVEVLPTELMSVGTTEYNH